MVLKEGLIAESGAAEVPEAVPVQPIEGNGNNSGNSTAAEN